MVLQKWYFDYVWLGKVCLELLEFELIIWDGDLLSFNFFVIKGMEALGQECFFFNGFSSDEVCQIVCYVGMSDKLKFFGIYGFEL